MRNLLALVGLVVIGFAGAGWYLGWYKLGVESNNPSHPKFNVEIESDKIKQDLQKGAKTVGSVVGKEVNGQLVRQQVTPSELPPLPAPPPPPAYNPGTTEPPLSIPPPPPPTLPKNFRSWKPHHEAQRLVGICPGSTPTNRCAYPGASWFLFSTSSARFPPRPGRRADR